ncbi:hypothetical protein GCM10009001_01370 [Virgibacillus siamensis]|uniref:DUF3231 family protein n=2 Tax=Virgibacillus siamensis TaxID=480071 RepID=A0ABN1FEM9_9BACI
MGEANYKPLTASEIGALWSTYMLNSMTSTVFSYGLGYIQDQDVRTHVQAAYDQAIQIMDDLKSIFAQENFPVPIGFTEKDVNLKAPPLFDDTFYLSYNNTMGKLGIPRYGRFLSVSTRADIRTFFSNCLSNASMQFNQTTEALLSKGLLIRSPYISVPQKAEFVKNKKYMDGYSLFSDKRPLNAVEISHLNANIQTNSIGFMVCIGFGQTAKSQYVRDYMLKGKDIAKKHIKMFSDKLLESDVQSPMGWDESAKNSTEAAFSDKLMMYHLSLVSAANVEAYGLSVAESQRSDLSLIYSRLIAEVGRFAKEGADIMIKNGWLEEVPQADNRDQLIKKRTQK